MQYFFKNGLPRKEDYLSLLSSELYISQREYSDNFLHYNDLELKDYKNKWVIDPLGQWSRQWEYPFVEQEIKDLENNESAVRVLDAGSGVTFFPFLLSENYGYNVSCLDSDNSLDSIYRAINIKNKKNVNFTNGDLRKIPFFESYFDAVYCISVLEHTDRYEKIIDEFFRILKPGGKLIVTFDVSIDGSRDIDVYKSKKLLEDLCRIFNQDPSVFLDELNLLNEAVVYSTKDAFSFDPKLLPWKKPGKMKQISNSILGKSKPWPPIMTFFCISLIKKS